MIVHQLDAAISQPRRATLKVIQRAFTQGLEVIARAYAELIDMNHRLRCPLGAPVNRCSIAA